MPKHPRETENTPSNLGEIALHACTLFVLALLTWALGATLDHLGFDMTFFRTYIILVVLILVGIYTITVSIWRRLRK